MDPIVVQRSEFHVRNVRNIDTVLKREAIIAEELVRIKGIKVNYRMTALRTKETYINAR